MTNESMKEIKIVDIDRSTGTVADPAECNHASCTLKGEWLRCDQCGALLQRDTQERK